MPSNQYLSGKLVPAEAIRELSVGSFEHLSQRIDDALIESRALFASDADTEVGKIATFPDYVVVGTDTGKYFKAKFEDTNGKVVFSTPEVLNVPVVDGDNSSEFVNKYVVNTVDAILSGNKMESRDRIVALLQLMEDTAPTSDLADLVDKLVSADRTWRSVYSEQKTAICALVGDVLESINDRRLTAKYNSLFDSIPEEKFNEHSEETRNDLALIADKLEAIQTKAEASFYPFTDAVVKVEHSVEDEATLQQFATFAEDYLEDIHGIREHIVYAIEKEECVMCVGRIYDSLAEAMTDYEIAGTFVERMSRQLVGNE